MDFVSDTQQQTRQGFLTRNILLILATAMAMTLASFAQTPPPNDDYENRTQLTGTSIIFSGTTVGATVQTDELAATFLTPTSPWDPMEPTVWWTWTAPASGQVSIDLLDYSDDRIRTPSNDTSSYLAVWHDVDWTNFSYDTRQGQCDYGFWFGIPGHRHTDFFATAGVSYDIQVSAFPYGTFTLRLIQTNAPVILVPPANRLVSPGQSTFLGVVVGGLEPYSYQWRFNGSDIPQQTNVLLSLDNIDGTMAGSYTVVVSNSVGAVESPATAVTLRTNDVQPIVQCIGVDPTGALSFNLFGEPLTYYRIESSTNLTDWIPEQTSPLPLPYLGYTSLIFNKDQQTAFTISMTASQKFVRVARYLPSAAPGQSENSSEICINNLRKIRFAKELWDNNRNGGDWRDPQFVDTPRDDDISPYGVLGLVCPLDAEQTYDTSYNQNNMMTQPRCQIDTVHHVLEEPSEIR